MHVVPMVTTLNCQVANLDLSIKITHFTILDYCQMGDTLSWLKVGRRF